MQQMLDCYNDGTFAENSDVAKNRESAEKQTNEAYDELLSIPVQLEPKSTLGCVSFGAQNRLTFDNIDGKDRPPTNPNGSIISIKDIQETLDKQPASPATRLVPEQKDYFQ